MVHIPYNESRKSNAKLKSLGEAVAMLGINENGTGGLRLMGLALLGALRV